MRIGDHHIGTSGTPYIIAEIGVNHDGSAEKARELVAAAAGAGANAVKFQYFTAERLLSGGSRLAQYQELSGAMNPHSMLRELELSIDDLTALANHARGLHVDPIVTIFSLEHAREMRQSPWTAFKIASPDIVNRPLIEAVCDLGRPVILSTGASTVQEVLQAASWVNGCDFALMQCVSAYPTPAASAHLSAIATLRDLVNAPVGYSDHTTDECTGGFAVAAGAALLEKHITLNRSTQGPDHAMALEPDQFERFAKCARLAAVMLGRAQKLVHEIEMDVRRVSRQSIVAARKLRAGQVVTADDLTIKRPGEGIAPMRLHQLIGCTIAVDVEPDTVLIDEHFAARPAGKRTRQSARPANVA